MAVARLKELAALLQVQAHPSVGERVLVRDEAMTRSFYSGRSGAGVRPAFSSERAPLRIFVIA